MTNTFIPKDILKGCYGEHSSYTSVRADTFYYLTIKVTEVGKDVHILVITYHLTQYTQALVTSSWTAKCTAQAMWDQSIVHYGLPESIVSDQGQNFEMTSLQGCKIWQKYENFIPDLTIHKPLSM